ncbi:glycosyltransferase [Microbacterium sp. NPDC091313]
MSHPLRVLSLYEGFFAGGARILHTDVVAGLHGLDQQHAVLSIASEAVREGTVQPLHDDPRYQRLAAAGVPVTTLGRTASAAPPDRAAYRRAELEIAASAIAEADLVLSLKEQPLGLILALADAGLMPEVPVAACLHRSDPTHSGPALGWLVEAAASGLLTATISCAESTAAAYERAGVMTADRRVIANGVDLDRFAPGDGTEARALLGITASAPVVVYAARFDAMKDPGLLLRSVAAHQRLRPDTHYVLCGAGMTPDNPMLRAMADEAGVVWDERMRALGIRDDMPSIYRAADIVALTSAFGEASPLCLLEGAASGATPVTTAVGDAARSVAGFGVVTPHDPDAIAAAWQHVLAHRPGFREAALQARPRIGRDRMLADYRDAVIDCAAAAEAGEVAA